ncbi:MAG TPA: nucleoside phosphorylase [Longilinea sp.]|nr:nucleoside phosphorylase [Longilinea sp.]
MISNDDAPILEFDPDSPAILNPQSQPVMNEPLPVRGVLCFFQEVIDHLIANGKLNKIGNLRSEMGPQPIYKIEQDGQPVFVMHPGVGAPLAAGFLEELIAEGARGVLACGGCGVLSKEIVAGHAIILTHAVRDEGTSYHYLPPAREVAASESAVTALVQTLSDHNVPFILGKSWTTDGLYRETEAKRARRLAEGCVVVEMEAAAFFAVAQFRKIQFGQVVYGGDLVVPEGWDRRSWDKRLDVREALFWLAVDAAARLPLEPKAK